MFIGALSYKRTTKFEHQSFECGDSEMDELIDLNQTRITAMASFSDPSAFFIVSMGQLSKEVKATFWQIEQVI